MKDSSPYFAKPNTSHYFAKPNKSHAAECYNVAVTPFLTTTLKILNLNNMQKMSQHSPKNDSLVPKVNNKKTVMIIITNKRNLGISLISGWEFNQILTCPI
jgi:hypothetical protein